MVVSRHPDIVASIENIKAFGYDRTLAERKVPGVYDIARLGINYRMNEIAAAIGLVQLKRTPDFARARSENAAALRGMLADVEELTLLPDGDARAVHANYCLGVVLGDAVGARRAEIMTALKERGVGASVHYPVPLPLSKYYKARYGADARAFPHSLRISSQSIALPIGPHLTTDDMSVIARELKDAITKWRP
jgi:dTDP-4-amino-4,6-dideoxygalactose transaminase